SVTLEDFFTRIDAEQPLRVKGTAVFMTLNRNVAPAVLLHHYEHNHALHERILLLSILPGHEPEIPEELRVRITDLTHGFVKIVAKYGYMETPDVQDLLRR